MKINKSDLPRKDFSVQNYMISLTKAIRNNKEGNYKECGLTNEEEFISILDTLEKSGVIYKTNKQNKEYNLSNYSVKQNNKKNKNIIIDGKEDINYNINITINLNDRKEAKTWLIENAVPLLAVAFEIVKLVFIK